MTSALISIPAVATTSWVVVPAPTGFEFSIGPGDASVWDIISNFRAAADRLDLTWIGCRFSGVTALDPSATTIAANSVGWQTSGGNTFVYANTSGGVESLTATGMKIESRGNIPLTNANFIHIADGGLCRLVRIRDKNRDA